MTLQWAIAPEAAGSQIRVSVGAESVTGVTESTGSWSNYRDVKLGSVHITKPGQIMITIRATRAASAVMNLRSVTLTHAP